MEIVTIIIIISSVVFCLFILGLAIWSIYEYYNVITSNIILDDPDINDKILKYIMYNKTLDDIVKKKYLNVDDEKFQQAAFTILRDNNFMKS